MIKKCGNKLTPLCFLPSGNLVCYSRAKILVVENDNIIARYPISITRKEKFFGKYNYIYRLLRMGIRTAEAIDNTHVVYSIGNMLYELNLTNGKTTKGYYCGKGIRPLIFTNVKEIDDFDDGIYFGGYLGNRQKEPVSVYKRVGEDKWDIVYTFPYGTINHVHTIVPDRYRQCLWIFTGDFDKSSAIWRVKDNFKKVECIVCNEQKFRGCVAFSLPEGILYATDSPFESNYIYMLNPITFDLKEVTSIDGSCIYGCQWKDKYVFSSTVEGDGRNTSKIQFYFGRELGAGIRNEYVHLYCGNLKDGFKEIYREKKDLMPIYTFQFGVFKFPSGINNTDTLYFQPTATDKNDLCLLAYKE